VELFLDLYGFLSVVLHAAELMARSVLLGSIAFLAFLAVPLAGRLPTGEGAMLLACARRAILWGGGLTLGTVVFSSGLGAVALVGTLDLGAGQAAGAGFVLSALGVMACAVVALVLVRGAARALPLLVVGLVLLVCALAGSHAMARTEDRLPMLAATFIATIFDPLFFVMTASRRPPRDVEEKSPAHPAGEPPAAPAMAAPTAAEKPQ
jgi:putative copper resistance protein D